MEYGIQLYSVRDEMKNDVAACLAKIAALGYKTVEFAGFFGHSPAEITEMLAANGLKLSGTHTGLAELVENYDKTLAYHKAIGNRYYIIPGHDLSTQGKIDEFVAQVNEIQPKLAAEGITLAFHNHSREFLPNEDGSVSYDDITNKTKLALEIDTYWAYVAGKDPLALMEQLKDRLVFIHLKDGTSAGEGFPLGMGTAPAADVYRKAVAMGVPIVVESETQKPDGFTEAEICMAFMKGLE